MAGKVKKVFETHVKVLEAIITDITENPSTCVNDAETLDFFWIKICLAVQCISKDATNLCMAFSKPPAPAAHELEALLKKLDGDSVALVSAFYSLSVSHGLTLKRSLHRAVVSIVQSVSSLVLTLQDQESNSNIQLQKTGSVWECCDLFPSLPRDNHSAVLTVIRQSQQLVNDALQEFEDAQKQSSDVEDFDDFLNEDDFMASSPVWSEEDKQLQAPAVGVVKATKACMKKTVGVVKSQNNTSDVEVIQALDTLREKVDRVSPAVDELMSVLYPPMESGGTIKENVNILRCIVKSLLEILRESSLTQNTDEAWIDFLTQATDHNYQKLCQLIPGD